MRHGFIKVASASPSLKVGNPDYNKDRIIEFPIIFQWVADKRE